MAELLTNNLNKTILTDTAINKAITSNKIEDMLSRKVNADFASQKFTTGDKENSTSESNIGGKKKEDVTKV